MIESTLWEHLRPELQRRGKFQKISDRFTPGVPDMLGMCNAVGLAWELKELEGVIRWKTKFRPLQLDWLRDWERAGGQSLIVSSHRQTMFAHRWEMGELLEAGMPPTEVISTALVTFTKTRQNEWRQAVDFLLDLTLARSGVEARTLDSPSGKLRKRRSGPI